MKDFWIEKIKKMIRNRTDWVIKFEPLAFDENEEYPYIDDATVEALYQFTRQQDQDFVQYVLGNYEGASAMLFHKIKEQKEKILEAKQNLEIASKAYVDAIQDGEYVIFAECLYDQSLQLKEELERFLKRLEWQRKIALGKADDDSIEFRKKIEIAKQVPIGEIIHTPEENKSPHTGFYICPMHTEKTGSLCWYKKDNRWKCFGACGTSGDVIDLYMAIHKVNFNQAISTLCAKAV